MGLFLHQTTTMELSETVQLCCLWVFSYIKPQHPSGSGFLGCVVYGSFPTSNHNLSRLSVASLTVVYGSFPTSNHNFRVEVPYQLRLFMGLFLHQTTTGGRAVPLCERCLWVFSYIKPQRPTVRCCALLSCLWVFSYIKPQLSVSSKVLCRVVYGSFPTSNHNAARVFLCARVVVYGSFPTSNHNCAAGPVCCHSVVYGSFPTSNHNPNSASLTCRSLFMGLFLHQTTTGGTTRNSTSCCLWVFSYIKPQLPKA